MKKWFPLSLMLSLGTLMTACGDNDNDHSGHSAPKLKNQQPAAHEFFSDTAASDVTIEILAGDDMKFNYREINVKEGQNIQLILVHTGKINKGTMGHNWVLLKEGTDVTKFANKAINRVEQEYIPEDTGDIIVHTRLLGGGERDTITFAAPPKGMYNYLCSFAGHAAIMRGKFVVN